MIAVLASDRDTAAHALVQAWRDDGAVLIGTRDLCTRGWVFDATPTGAADGERFVADGRVRRSAALRGVLVRRPAVAAEELAWIAAADRAYACAEISAFLVAWLDALPCPVLNRPTPNCLSGPAWSQRQWRAAAACRGVAWSTLDGGIARDDLVYCNGAAHGSSTATRLRACRALAEASDTALLGICFAGDAVAAVTTQPSLADDAARELVRAAFDPADRRRQEDAA